MTSKSSTNAVFISENIAIEMYQSIFDNAIEGIFQSTPAGRLIIANPALARIFGYDSPEEMVCSVTNLGEQLYVNQSDRGRFVEELKCNGVVVGFETLMYRKDGTKIWISLNARPICDDDGNMLHLNGTLDDITERKRNRELLQEKEAAEEANKAKTEFLVNMSHELRTPMNSILGFCEMMLQDDVSQEHHEYLNRIFNSGMNLLSIINDILDLSKIESQKLDIEMIDTSLNTLLDEVESSFLPKAAEKQIEFKVVKHTDLPETINTDPLRLNQCLVNLVGNAIKFTETGHVHLIVSFDQNAGQLRFSVEDTGIGIEPEKMRVIFDPFTQADGSTTRKYGGTGLGLTITKQLVEMLDGYLEMESEVGKGTRFSINLPINPSI